MKIYDCFTFFNELTLLELRLETLWDTVDYFIIAESPYTHSGQSKPLYFADNQHLFAKYKEKIRHIVVTDMPEGQTRDDAWSRERHQRKSLARGLWDIQPNDLVITSDADEIPRPSCIQQCRQDTQYSRWILFCPTCIYKLNYMRVKGNHGIDWDASPNIIVTRTSVFTDPQTERSFTFPWQHLPENVSFISHGGWHWCSIGDDAHGVLKLQSFSHTEANVPEIIDNFDINKFVQNKTSHERPGQYFEPVIIDDYYPEYVINNLEKFKEYVITSAQLSTCGLYAPHKIHTSRT
jgi:hypothetical protein